MHVAATPTWREPKQKRGLPFRRTPQDERTSAAPEIGPVMKKLRETLTGIQSGAVEDKHDWVYTVA